MNPHSTIAGFLAIALGITATPGASAHPAGSAIDAALEYFHAYSTGDMDRLSALAEPAVIRQAGGLAAFRTSQKAFAARDRTMLQIPQSERVRTVRVYEDSVIALYFVSTTRIFEGFPGPIEQDHLYVVSSSDRGLTFKVADLSCIDTDWLKLIAPSFHDETLVSELSAR